MPIVFLNIAPEIIRERRYDKPNYPDPALGALQSYLNEYNVKSEVIDSKLDRINLKKTINRLESLKPTVIGLTSFTHEIETVAYAAGVMKNKFPKAKLIIGGAHANALNKKVLMQFPVFDIAVYGEGEETMMELVKNKFENLKTILGIAYRKNSDVFINNPRPFLDTGSIPLINWSKFSKARYYPVFTSRGCNYKCIFCSRPFGSVVRFRPVPDIIEEIRRIKKAFNPKIINFWDENFCADRARALNLLEKIRSDKDIKNIKWFCQAHVNNLDYKLLKLMKETGCIRIGIGIESGDNNILKKIKKGSTKEQIIRVASWLKEIKIPFEGYFLLGLPDENWQTAMDTIKFAAKINPKYPVFGIVAPYPGTEIYSMAMRGNGGYKIISNRWGDYNKLIGKAMELNNLSRRQLETLQFYGYMSVLVKNLRIVDVVRFIFQFHEDIKGYLINFFQPVKNNE